MSNHAPLRPDPMPLREALRAMRHVMRRSGDAMRETIPLGVLPGPAEDFAKAVFHQVEHLAQNIDAFASGLAKKVVGVEDAPPATLRGLPEDASAFAAAAYAGLRAVLAKLGAESAFVSEAAARKAYAGLQARHPSRADGDLPVAAAALMLEMLDNRVVRDVGAEVGLRLAAPAVPSVAVFSVLLWMLADRTEAEGEEALVAATDIALAVAGDVTAAAGAADPVRLAALLAEFAHHV